MAKQKKSRKHKKYSPVKTETSSIKEMLPPGHRFDKEIADACSTVLLRVQMKRMDQPTAVEKEVRHELKTIIARKQLSRVAINFFSSIISICNRQPLLRAATRILNATYKEFVIVESHMALLTEISMLQRIENLIGDIKNSQWHIEELHDSYQSTGEEPLNFLAYHQDWRKKCDDNGQLMETMSLAVRTENIDDFIEKAYQRGLLIHKVGAKTTYYHLKIHPENNVPGIPLSPPSIQVEELVNQ